MGLLALMLLQHARRGARTDALGEVVLLEDQDRTLWDPRPIAEGLALIDKAMRHRRAGPYQIQAAIAATHARAKPGRGYRAGGPRSTALRLLGARPAFARGRSPEPRSRCGENPRACGWRAGFDRAPGGPALGGYFHYFGAKGALLLQLQRPGEAREAFNRAIALAADPAQAAFIREALDRRKQDDGAAPLEKLTHAVGTATPPAS